MLMRASLLLLVSLVASSAQASPVLVTWRQADLTGVVAWRLYLQQEGDPVARTIEIPIAEVTPHPEGIYGRFVDRDPLSYLWVAVVAVHESGEESDSTWSRVYPPLDRWLPCQLDFDRSGAVGITDWGVFSKAYGQQCPTEP
jgi:hypothetical protein